MKPAILCLNSHQFNRDVNELINSGQRYQYLLMPDTVLVDGQPWIPEPMRDQSIYVNFSGPDVDRIWDKSRRFGRAVIEDARRSGANVVAAMAGNWDYWNEECIRLACAELGLPFLVLLRENFLYTHGLRDNIAYFSRFSRIPQPDAIAMAGDVVLRLFEEMSLFPNVPMVATGWPRLDVWRRPAKPMRDRPVVLMSYFKGYEADQHFLDMLEIFDDMARRHPDVPFVVKAKHTPEALQLVKVMSDRGLSVPVADVMELPSLLCNARAVIGFNSMVMYEALLSPAHLIVPHWGQTEQDPDMNAPSPLDERLVDHMTFATSEKTLREMVAWAIAGKLPPIDMTKRTRTFGAYATYTEDRTSVERVEDFIDAALRPAQ